jgi:hypothetical protein
LTSRGRSNLAQQPVSEFNNMGGPTLDTVQEKEGRPITAVEVNTWIGKTKQKKLSASAKVYGKIAADLNSMR